MSFDPRNISRPTTLRLNPFAGGLSLQAYQDVIAKPTPNPVNLEQLLFNSFRLATSTGLASIIVGVFASYAFSRLRFKGREVLMIAVLGVLMLPSIATLPALFVLLNKVQFQIGATVFNLRNSLIGSGGCNPLWLAAVRHLEYERVSGYHPTGPRRSRLD